MDVLALFSQSRTALLLCDADRRITEVNAAASALLRDSVERVTGRLVEELVTDAGRTAAARELASLGAPGGAPDWLPFTLRAGDGAPFRAELTWRSGYLPGRHLVALRPAPAGPEAERRDRLTERESAILSRVARGETGPEIADGLFLSVATVERDVSTALRRLGARNRAHGIAIAVRTGQLAVDVPAGAPDADEEPATTHGLALEALDGPAALIGDDDRVAIANVAWRALDDDAHRLVVAPGERFLDTLDRAGSTDLDAAQAAWGIREVVGGHVVCFVLGYRLGPADDGRWFEMRVSRYGGSPQLLLVRHRDVTGERHAAFGTAALDEVGAAVVFLDTEGAVTSWRPSAERMFGVPATEAVGRPAWEVVMTERQHDVGRSLLAEVLRSGRWAGELTLVRQDGSSFCADVRLRVVNDEDAAPAQIVGAAIDVTDRVDALRRSMDARAELQAVSAGMREGCVVLDSTGRIHSANPAVTTLLGWQADGLVGRTMHDVLRSPLPGVDTEGPAPSEADGEIHVDRFLTPDDHEVPVEYTVTRFDSADNSDRWAVVFRRAPGADDPVGPAA